jgi:redox-sensitive bicupin YhaK (pirin superfamily)
MKIKDIKQTMATQDGDGVLISRVADFSGQALDPFLMIDEIKSGDESDYIGGFPPHPHRGIETFTYMLKGGFEHRDQMGNVKAIQAGDVQWMSTGSGVIHSEMPLVDADKKMHGFQIWLNMPAKDKMRPSSYFDSVNVLLPELVNNQGAVLKALAGDWQFSGAKASSPIQGLAGGGAIADLTLRSGGKAQLDLAAYGNVFLYIHSGSLINGDEFGPGTLIIVDSQDDILLQASEQATGVLVLAGQPIKEEIVHMGPFVMNTPEQIQQAIADYHDGKFGEIA